MLAGYDPARIGRRGPSRAGPAGGRELVTEAKLSRLLEVAKESYEMIVVDTSPFFHGPMLATLDRTDELLLLCGLDVPTIKNVRLSLQTLELLSFPTERIRVVLNRANSNVGMGRSKRRSSRACASRSPATGRCHSQSIGQPPSSPTRRPTFARSSRDGEGPSAGVAVQVQEALGRKQSLAKAS